MESNSNESPIKSRPDIEDDYTRPQLTTEGIELSSRKLDLTWWESFVEAARRSSPNIITMVFFQFVQLLNIYYIGQIGSDYLAGVGMGNMLLNVCIFAFSNGFNGTVESFISWALG